MEQLILYLVLFFPNVFSNNYSTDFYSTGIIQFSLINELGRTLTYTIPSLALLWYIILGKISGARIPAFKEIFYLPELKFSQKRDLCSLLIGLPGLILTGIVISLLISGLSPDLSMDLPLKVQAPDRILGWIVLVFSCLGTGYLEESFFRYYLLSSLEINISKPAIRVIIAAILFSFCHIYEGPWGILNAALAGILLSVLFIRYRSIHGIAWAHGAYNLFVYIMGYFTL